MYPVLRSCEVLPAFAAAMQTMAPTEMATGAYTSPVQPSATKIKHVMIRVAIVMPEMGLDEDPIKPVIRDDTVAKKNPKMTIKIETRMLPCVGRPGVTARKIASSNDPINTT